MGEIKPAQSTGCLLTTPFVLPPSLCAARKCRPRQIAITVTINLLLACCSVVKGGDEPGRFTEGGNFSAHHKNVNQTPRLPWLDKQSDRKMLPWGVTNILQEGVAGATLDDQTVRDEGLSMWQLPLYECKPDSRFGSSPWGQEGYRMQAEKMCQLQATESPPGTRTEKLQTGLVFTRQVEALDSECPRTGL